MQEVILSFQCVLTRGAQGCCAFSRPARVSEGREPFMNILYGGNLLTSWESFKGDFMNGPVNVVNCITPAVFVVKILSKILGFVSLFERFVC